MIFIHLSAILFSILGMLILDWRYSLAFFYRAKRTAITLAIGVLAFLVWDIFGISLGIFFDGGSPITTGLMLAPNLPIEEIFFLFFLCYITLIIYRLLEKKC